MPREDTPQVNINAWTIIKVALFALLAYVVYLIRDLALVFLTALVIASFVEAAGRKLRSYGFGRAFSVILIYVISIALLGGVLYAIVPVLAEEISGAVSSVAKLLPQSGFLSDINLEPVSSAGETVSNLVHTGSLVNFFQSAGSLIQSLSSGVLETLSFVFGGIVNLVLVMVVSFYLSMQEKGIENFLRIVIPNKHEDYAVDLWQRSERKIAQWVKGQLVLSLIIGVLVYLLLTLFGVRYALVIALLSAVLELVPFGSILAGIPAVGLAYMDGGLNLALIVTGIYIIIQQFETYLLYPVVVQKVVGISTLAVILSVLIGAKLAGFWGLILAVPIATVIIEFMNDIKKKKIFARAVPTGRQVGGNG